MVTGKVLFTLGESDGQHDYVCSAGAVADNADGDANALVLTAGHCVYDDAGAVWATNWTFFPDYGNSGVGRTVRDCASNTLGCWTAQSLFTSSRWAEAGDFSYDFAFARVGPGGTDGTKFLEAAIDTTGGGASPAPVGFNRVRGEFLTSFGYPHAAPYDGQDLYYCAGGAQAYDRFNKRFLNTYDQGLKCDMTGGSSGGTWFADFKTGAGTGIATSVNSFKYVNDESTMYGPYFGNYAKTVYLAAVSASASGANSTIEPPTSLP